MKTILLSATLLLLSFCTFAQQPGTVDESFGTKGKVVFPYGTKDYHGSIGGVVEKDNSIINVDGAVVLSGNREYPAIQLTRFLPDGTYDTGFADHGKADFSFGFDEMEPISVAMQPDGKILVAGYVYNYAAHPVYYGFIVRANADGSLDTEFGDSGIVKNSYTKDVIFNTVCVAPDNKIIAAGNSSDFSSVVSRYLPDGTPDPSFGVGGNASLAGGLAFSSVVQPDGKVVVGGPTTGNGISTSFILARYTQNGTPDETFGKSGVVKTAYGELSDEFDNLAIQKDGKILGAGVTGGDYIPIILRYNENGTVDSSFGTNGAVETVYSDATVGINDMVALPDGRILCADGGARTGENVSDFSLFQLNSDGSLDSSFGTNGKTLVDMGYGLADAAYSIGFQSDGKIVLIGSSDNGVDAVYTSLLRCYGEKGQKPIVIKIKRFLQHHGITWQTDNNVRYYTVQRSMDGGVTYQPVAKLYNNHQSALIYEDASATGDNAVYRVAVVAKDGGRSFSNSVALTSETGVRVFPNPVRSTLQVQGLPQSKSSLNITDFSGNVRTSAVASGGTASLNTSALKPGNYLLKVQSGNTVETKAFVKE